MINGCVKMQEKMSLVSKCIVSVLILNFLCFFIQMSFTIVAVGVGTKPIGYDIYMEIDGEQVKQYTHYYEDGDDARLEAMDKAGTEYNKVELRTSIGKAASFVVKGLTMVCSLSIFCALIYSALWKAGDSDNNRSVYGGGARDRLKGLKIGLMAASPFALLYVLLVINKFSTFWPGIYGIFKIANYYLFPLVTAAYGSAMNVAGISIGGLALLLLTLVPIPLAAGLGYYFGNSEISIKNKIVYVKEKK